MAGFRPASSVSDPTSGLWICRRETTEVQLVPELLHLLGLEHNAAETQNGIGQFGNQNV